MSENNSDPNLLVPNTSKNDNGSNNGCPVPPANNAPPESEETLAKKSIDEVEKTEEEEVSILSSNSTNGQNSTENPVHKSSVDSNEQLLTELDDILPEEKSENHIPNEPQHCQTDQNNLENFSSKNGISSPSKASISNGSESPNSNSAPGNSLVTSPNLDKIAKLCEKYSVQCVELERVEKQNAEYREQLVAAMRERDGFQKLIHESQNSQSAKIQEAERKLLEYEYQMKALKDRGAAQEAHYRKSTADLQAKHAAQIEQLKKSTDSAQKEKNESVIKFAQREAEILKLETSRNRLADQLKHVTTERDALNAGLRGAKNEKSALQAVLEQRESDLMDTKKELERMRSFFNEADVRVKIATKRQDDAESAQKETKAELDKCQRRLVEAKEEAETVRADCQRIVKQYQEQQDKKMAELSVQKQEQSDQAEIYRNVLDEMNALKKQHKEAMKDAQGLRDRVGTLEGELSRREAELEAERTGRSQDLTNLESLTKVADSVESCKRKAAESEEAMKKALEERDQAEKESAQNREQAEKMLELTEHLSAKNSALAAENNALDSKAVALEETDRIMTEQLKEATERISIVDHELAELKACTSAEISSLQDQLNEKVKKEQELSTQVEDERNLNKVLKKKHAAGLKDLKNELSLMKRRLDAYEAGTASQGSAGHGHAQDGATSMSSRASSVTSLEAQGPQLSSSRLSEDSSQMVSNSDISPGGQQEQQNNQSDHSVNCVHNQAMIEKIVKLQRQLARRSEKIEFLEEHVKQLIDEMQKKSRIVQMFALREEAGALVPESVDINKAQMVQRGHTVMGSVFGGGGGANANSGNSSVAQSGKGRRSSANVFNPQHQHTGGVTDSKLTLELSMEINGKLQAVLEDTLLKNITLKENMETLGQEISKLSRENRELRLKIEERSNE